MKLLLPYSCDCGSGRAMEEARGDPVLSRSLRALVHPATVAAVVLLLVNDHVLRQQSPAWWTGKLGDVAWLAFAPLLVAPLIALLVPSWVRWRSHCVICLSAGVVVTAFTAVKAVPTAHAAFHRVLRSSLPVA